MRRRLLMLNRWKPANETGLAIWYRASDSLIDSANNVSQLSDISGFNRNATQTTGAAQPLFVPNGLGGLPVIQFNGSSHYLNVSDLGIFRNMNSAMVVALVRCTTNPSVSVFSAATGTAGVRLRLSTSAGNFDGAGRRLDADSFQSQSGGVVNTNWVAHGIRARWSEAILNITGNRLITGTLNPFQSAGLTSDTDSATVRVGRELNNASYFTGELAELLVYTRVVPGTDFLNRLCDYWNAKYGVNL